VTFDEDMKIPVTTTWSAEWAIDINKPLKEIFASLHAEFAKVGRAFHDTLAIHEKNLPHLLEVMIRYSWYPDFAIPISDSRALEAYAKAKAIDKIENYLIAFYRSSVARIEMELAKAYPHRLSILSEAFSAYRNKQYILSIPVLLAQADGISEEILHQHFFRAIKSIPEAKKKANNPDFGSYTLILLEPLLQLGTIRENTKNLLGQTDYLNRHGIMHGSDLQYGTEKNALKSISLLSYLNAVRITIK